MRYRGDAVLRRLWKSLELGLKPNTKIVEVAAVLLGGLTANLLVALILAWPLMWLWNAAVVVALPVAAEIGWLEAAGIYIFFALLQSKASFNYKV